jgi:hypothetical protein
MEEEKSQVWFTDVLVQDVDASQKWTQLAPQDTWEGNTARLSGHPLCM